MRSCTDPPIRARGTPGASPRYHVSGVRATICLTARFPALRCSARTLAEDAPALAAAPGRAGADRRRRAGSDVTVVRVQLRRAFRAHHSDRTTPTLLRAEGSCLAGEGRRHRRHAPLGESDSRGLVRAVARVVRVAVARQLLRQNPVVHRSGRCSGASLPESRAIRGWTGRSACCPGCTVRSLIWLLAGYRGISPTDTQRR